MAEIPGQAAKLRLDGTVEIVGLSDEILDRLNQRFSRGNVLLKTGRFMTDGQYKKLRNKVCTYAC